MSRKREFIAGMMAGALLFGGTGAVAAGLTAQPSNQAIYVDGQRVYFTAYAVGANNYVQLREVGRILDFGVSYDAATNSVRISTDSPYVEQSAVSAQTTVQQAAQSSAQQTAKPTTQSAASADKGIDYAQEANPEIFTSTLTREFYNSARYAYLHSAEMAAGYDKDQYKADESLPIFLPDGMTVTQDMKTVCRAIGGVGYTYEITAKAPYAYAFPRTDSDLDGPRVQAIIAGTKKRGTDREKAEYLAKTLCDEL